MSLWIWKDSQSHPARKKWSVPFNDPIDRLNRINVVNGFADLVFGKYAGITHIFIGHDMVLV